MSDGDEIRAQLTALGRQIGRLYTATVVVAVLAAAILAKLEGWY